LPGSCLPESTGMRRAACGDDALARKAAILDPMVMAHYGQESVAARG